PVEPRSPDGDVRPEAVDAPRRRIEENGRVGEGARRQGERVVRRSRSDEEPARSVARDMKGTPGPPAAVGYHDVHLPEDPARAMVWAVIAEYLRPSVPAGAHVLEIGAGYCCWIN